MVKEKEIMTLFDHMHAVGNFSLLFISFYVVRILISTSSTLKLLLKLAKLRR